MDAHATTPQDLKDEGSPRESAALAALGARRAGVLEQLRCPGLAAAVGWSLRLGSGIFRCEACGNETYWSLLDRIEVRECRRCGAQARLRKGTPFENSRLPLVTWVRGAAYLLLSQRHKSTLQLQRFLDIGSYRTAVRVHAVLLRSLSEPEFRTRLEEALRELSPPVYSTSSTACTIIPMAQP